MKTPKYTIKEFRAEFPNDDVCLDKIFELRYNKVPCCPQCAQQTTFKRIQGRRAYQCSDTDCQYQLYPTAGTVFEKTRTSLQDWFYAIYLMTSTRNGVSAKELERQLGVTYKTAWRMGHCIRELMNSNSGDLLTGVVEADETYIGGKEVNKHLSKRKNGKEGVMGRGTDKAPLIAIVSRDGEARAFATDNVGSGGIYKIITENIEKGSNLITDAFTSYAWVGKQYNHTVIKHTKLNGERNYVTSGDRHTNSVEGFFSHFKRMVSGTHIYISKKYLQAYANECAFRYSHRSQGQQMFYAILKRVC